MANPGFPVGGGNFVRGDQLPTCLHSEKFVKMTESGQGAHVGYPLDPPMHGVSSDRDWDDRMVQLWVWPRTCVKFH